MGDLETEVDFYNQSYKKQIFSLKIMIQELLSLVYLLPLI